MTAPLHPRLDPACFAEAAARDERFTVVDIWADCVNLPDGHAEKEMEFFHRQMNEEAAVLENAARSLYEFPDTDWELRMWLARQAADEARHAENYRRLFVKRGGRIGQYPVLSFQYRILGRVHTLIGRLAVQNRTFEADGLDAVTHAITEARAAGDHELAAMYDAQQADEIVHIRFANDWIKLEVARNPRALMAMGQALALAARGFQQTFDRDGSRVSKYGVAEDLRSQAGFSAEEIEGAVAMTERRRAAVRGDGA
jgi:uncharacterized ferritin-like protein (DUF455 family)